MNEQAARPWRAALLWLIFLGPFFFASYSFANWYTAQRPFVGSFAFSWERYIPFWPWTIVPYWSIDLLYALSVFLCLNRRELNVHALRLATATAISVAGFLLFPLKFSFVRPETHGLFGVLFASLTSFDLPYNQAPSLHISLLWLLWLRYAAHAPARWRWVLHSWFFLIGLSVLTTWQHHVIDVISGLATGVLISYALPMAPQRWRPWQASPRSRQVGLRYGLAGLLLLALQLTYSGWTWLLLWPTFSLLLVAAAYLLLGPACFQKQSDGKQILAAAWLLAPHRLGARLSLWRYRPQLPPPSWIADDVLLSHYPRSTELQGVTAVLDLCAELPRAPATAPLRYSAIPLLDLVPPSANELQQAVAELEQLRQHGPVLLHCALGLSRSAAVAAAWLLSTGRAANPAQAIERVRTARPGIVLHDTLQPTLQQMVTANA